MSLNSMTGFGRAEASNSNFRVTVEIKSVNQRFKDFRFRLPSALSSQEIEFKRTISQYFSRGTFEVSLNYKKNNQQSGIEDLDHKKIKAFVDQMTKALNVSRSDFSIRPTDFLRSEFYLDQDDSQSEELVSLSREAFSKATSELLESRKEEGEKLSKVLTNHLDEYSSLFQEIESRVELFQEGVEQKLRQRFKDFQEDLKVDESRFMQEVVFYLEKLDVHEEINRIKSHLKKFDKLLTSKGEAGRQIEFLLQELGRETNTIGSKSNTEEISERVVLMKVQLEKMREQALNLE